MLPLFPEYHANHHRFREHLRIALFMALIAPLCAFVFYQQLDWWNPWLWGCSVTGLSLALCLYSVVKIVNHPHKLTSYSTKLAARSEEWFPFFFVVMQSLISSLIIIFVWFSITALALNVPAYVHVSLVLLALLLPVRRYYWAKMTVEESPAHEKIDETLHGVSHILMSIFLARFLIGLTVANVENSSTPTVIWQIIVWIPAAIYMLYTGITMFHHLLHGKQKAAVRTPNKVDKQEDPVDQF